MKRVTDIDGFIGKKLKNRRLMLNLSQESLADKVGLTFQQIQKYEQGKNRISASRMYQFMKILNVEPNYFFDGIEDFEAEISGQSKKLSPVISKSLGNQIEEEIPKVIKLYGSIHDHADRYRVLETLKIWANGSDK